MIAAAAGGGRQPAHRAHCIGAECGYSDRPSGGHGPDGPPGGAWLYWPAGPRGPRSHSGDLIVTEAEIEAKVIDIVAEQMGVDKGTITRETNFTNDLHADSLDTVELVMEFEDEFETSIPDEQAEKIQTIGQAIEYIKDSIGVDA
jgi:acyl carrier protein